MKKIITLCLLLSFVSFGQSHKYKTHEFGQPFIKYYSPKEYQAGRENWSIIQDKLGIIYVGNQNCILEFDGTNWRKISVPNNDLVRALDIDESGRIYATAGTDFGYMEPNGLGQLNFKSLLPYLDKKDKNTGEFWDVCASKHGIYFKTSDKIYRWNGINVTVWDSVFAFRLYNIEDKIYTRNHGTGLMMIDGDSLKLMPNGEYFKSIGVYNMLPYKGKFGSGNQKILITTNDNGLFLHDGNKFIPLKTEVDSFLISHQIYNACLMKDGNYALSTQRGGVVLINSDGKMLRIINKNSSLPTDVVFDVYAVKNGGLWFATLNGIAYCEEPSAFSIFKDKGLLEETAYSVLRFNSKLYVTNELGVFYLSEDESSFKLVTKSDKPAYKLLNVDEMRLAYTNDGIAIINDTKYSKVLDLYGVAIIKSKKYSGRIYVGTDTGFSVLMKNGNIDASIRFQKNMKDAVTTIVEDEDGSLWMSGLFKGIYHVIGKMEELGFGIESNVEFKFYDEKIKGELPAEILNIYEIQNKTLFATKKGIYKFNENSKMFLPDSTLGRIFSDSTNTIELLRKNQNGDLWILADLNGEKNLGKAILQNDRTCLWKSNPEFKRLDLNSVLDIYSEYKNDSKTEILWICTDNALIKYTSNSSNNITEHYSTIIRKIVTNNDSLIYAGKELTKLDSEKVILPFTKNDIRFEYSAVTFDKPEATLYQYYLEGNDETWSPWNSETKKEYTNLAKGNYKFHVRAKNVYGVICEGDEFAFEILAPWYYTYWAFAFYAFLIILGIYITDRIMRQKVIKKEREKNQLREAEFRVQNAELQAKAAEAQSRIMQIENDRKTKELEEARDLQLSMLPKEVPAIHHLDIAVYMKTATEVGGDYYDFSTMDDGSMNIALGDATGHGMKAGILVSMIKSLFVSNSVNKSIEDFFNSSNKALKKANLKRMVMSFVMININGDKAKVVNAGMPPIYHYKKEDSKIYELNKHSLPLGSMLSDTYSVTKLNLNSGDIILMMSDGYPELQNTDGELLGYELCCKYLQESASKTPNQIIDFMNKKGLEHITDNEPEDDVTFVVIKVK